MKPGIAAFLLLMAASSDALAFRCWKASLGEQGNSALLCVDVFDRAEHRFYFSNKGTKRPPTTCSTKGHARPRPSGQVAIKLGDGSCDNGRDIAGVEFICDSTSEPAISCEMRREDGSTERWKFDGVFP